MADLSPAFSSEVVRGSHEPNLDHPAETARPIRAFLAPHPSARGLGQTGGRGLHAAPCPLTPANPIKGAGPSETAGRD